MFSIKRQDLEEFKLDVTYKYILIIMKKEDNKILPKTKVNF